MCERCDNVVIGEMDIRDTDLPNLPFKTGKWSCIVPGCKGGAKIRDYGIGPFFYWAVRVIRGEKGWRGGWFSAPNHTYMCSKHWPMYKKGTLPKDIPHSEEINLSKIKIATK